MGERLEGKLQKLTLWVTGIALLFAYLVVSRWAS